MKTPNEIKKGLECCNTYNGCQNCHYDDKVDKGWGCCVQRNADALAYIRELEAKVPKWISVKASMPEEADEVLVFCRNGETTWTNLAHRVGKQWWRAGVPMLYVTHWMPLPEPPEGE